MRKFLISRKVFFTVSAALAFLITYVLMHQIVRSAYESYWIAIDRVQTVDFNVLASTSIGTVSNILKSGDTEKAHEFVLSNYCLFRIQIERCADVNCKNRTLVADNAISESTRCTALKDGNKQYLEIPVFNNTTSMATVTFDHSYTKNPKTVAGSDDPIGFLILSRGNRVPFDIDFTSFFQRWIKGEANASRHKMYKTAAYVSVLLGLLTFFLLFIIRQFYLSHLKRKVITEKLVRVINQKIQKTSH